MVVVFQLVQTLWARSEGLGKGEQKRVCLGAANLKQLLDHMLGPSLRRGVVAVELRDPPRDLDPTAVDVTQGYGGGIVQNAWDAIATVGRLLFKGK